MPRLSSRTISTAAVQREVERRLATLRDRAEGLKQHNGHPQVLRALYLTEGEIEGLDSVLQMITQKTQRVPWW